MLLLLLLFTLLGTQPPQLWETPLEEAYEEISEGLSFNTFRCIFVRASTKCPDTSCSSSSNKDTNKQVNTGRCTS